MSGASKTKKFNPIIIYREDNHKVLREITNIITDIIKQLMKLILFGAGASFFDEGIYPYKPPLGNQLFQKIMDERTQDLSILDEEEIHIFKEKGFEDGMKNLFKKVSPKSKYIMRIIGSFFTKFQLDPQYKKLDLYSYFLLLLKKLPDFGDYTFATLNYECLLEEAMVKSLEWHPNLIYNKKLIKPHGSCNFWCMDPDPIKGLGGISMPLDPNIKREITHLVEFNCSNIYALPRSKINFEMLTSDKYPVMAFYGPEKKGQMGANFIKQSKDKLSKVIKNSEKIVIIGVKPVSGDEHIWNPIINTKAEILYVSPSNDDFSNLKDLKPKAQVNHISRTFEMSINKIIEFLKKEL